MAKAWLTARRQAHGNRTRHQARDESRTAASDWSLSLRYTAERAWEKGLCAFCLRKRGRMRVGFLPKTGRVRVCPGCWDEYQWHKREEGR